MKQRLLVLLGVIVAAIIAWVVLANKFESTVQNTYLPILEQQKEQGLIDVDLSSIKIDKYIFKVTMDKLVVFSKSELFKTSFDQISIWVNPIAENIIACSSGKTSFSSGATGVYSKEPVILKVTRTILDGNIDNVRLSLEGKPFEIFSAVDDSSLMLSEDYNSTIVGKFDEKTNLYSLKFLENAKELKVSTSYIKWSSNLFSKISNIKKDERSSEIINEFVANYYQMVHLQEPIEYKGSYVVALSKEKLKEIYQIIQNGNELAHDIALFALSFDIKKEPFNISVNNIYGNRTHNNRVAVTLSGDGKDIRGNVGIFSNSNYKKDEIEKITSSMAQLFAKTFNEIQPSKSTESELKSEDLIKLADYVTNIKNIDISGNLVYKIEKSDFDSNLKIGLNDYTMEMNSQGKGNKSYTGTLKLSDPMKLINAKTKFVHEVVFPLAEKMVDKSKVNLDQLQRFIANIELNGFEALKVFNNSADSTNGDKFETSFSFEPEKFEFKVNDKSLLSIITDDRIVKFLKGFEEAGQSATVVPMETKIIDGKDSSSGQQVVSPNPEKPAKDIPDSKNNNVLEKPTENDNNSSVDLKEPSIIDEMN